MLERLLQLVSAGGVHSYADLCRGLDVSEGLLEQMLTEPAFAELRSYLESDDKGVKRWQLSERIADVFDRYQYYRPELIKTWSSSGGDDWQARLWRGLIPIEGSIAARLTTIVAPQNDLSVIFACPSTCIVQARVKDNIDLASKRL